MARSLLLNASFEPLCVVSSRRAVVLVLKEKAEIVRESGALECFALAATALALRGSRRRRS